MGDIWAYQRAFYQKAGIAAWVNQVPFYATSNAYIAKGYAETVAHFLLAQPVDSKITILEFSAGVGQFGYLFLQAMTEACQTLGIAQNRWRYVMTDFHQLLIDHWSTHPAFQPYLSENQLDFACFDIGTDTSLYLQRGDEVIEKGSISTPLVIFANYLFDSLPLDVIRVSNGEAYRLLLSARIEQSNLDNDTVKDFDSVALQYHLGDRIDLDTDLLARHYAEHLIDSNIIIPTAVLQLIDQVNDWSSAGALWVASDKGYAMLSELDHLDPPELTGHGGCFSFMTNFDAIVTHCTVLDGEAIKPALRAGFKTVLFSTGFSFDVLFGMKQVAKQFFSDFSPSDYVNLHRQMQKGVADYTLEAAASHLALSNWDPVAFQYLYPVIYQQLDGADMLTVDYISEHLKKVAKQFYFIPKLQDALFNIAIFFHTLKRYREALTYYQHSLEYYPAVFGVCFNIGICYFHLGEIDNAVDFFKKAEALDPEDENTQTWLQRLQSN